MKRHTHLMVLCALLQSTGCALLGKSEPLDVRYFDAVEPAAQVTPVTPVHSAGGQAEPLKLRLGLVKAAHHLDERIISRISTSELEYHETFRWTERPAELLRRALTKDLYEVAGFQRILSGPGATLEVELTAFEEIRESKQARVELNVVLHDDRVQLAQKTIRVEVPVKDRKELGAALAVALGSALGQAAQQVTSLTADTLNQVIAKRAQQVEQSVAEAP